jgi:hypothetical protein
VNVDTERLVGLEREALEALSSGLLAAAGQSQLADLLHRNAEGGLPADELAELDRILAHIDQLTILKARAILTLQGHHRGRHAH